MSPADMEHHAEFYQEMMDEHDNATMQSGELINTLNLDYKQQVPAQATVRHALAKKKSRDFGEMDIDLDEKEERLANLPGKGKPKRTRLQAPTITAASNLHRQAVSKGGLLAQQNRLAPKSSLSRSTTSANILEQLEKFNVVQSDASRSGSTLPNSNSKKPPKPDLARAELTSPYFALHMNLEQAMARMLEAVATAINLFSGMLDKDVNILDKISRHAQKNRDHTVRNACRELKFMAHLLRYGRAGWELSDMTDEFFSAMHPQVEKAESVLRQLTRTPCLHWLHRNGVEVVAAIGRRLVRVQEHHRRVREAENDPLAQELQAAMDAEHGDRDGDLGMNDESDLRYQEPPRRATDWENRKAMFDEDMEDDDD